MWKLTVFSALRRQTGRKKAQRETTSGPRGNGRSAIFSLRVYGAREASQGSALRCDRYAAQRTGLDSPPSPLLCCFQPLKKCEKEMGTGAQLKGKLRVLKRASRSRELVGLSTAARKS